MVARINIIMHFSVFTLLVTPFDIFAQILYAGLIGLSNVHFRIRFFIRGGIWVVSHILQT